MMKNLAIVGLLVVILVLLYTRRLSFMDNKNELCDPGWDFIDKQCYGPCPNGQTKHADICQTLQNGPWGGTYMGFASKRPVKNPNRSLDNCITTPLPCPSDFPILKHDDTCVTTTWPRRQKSRPKVISCPK